MTAPTPGSPGRRGPPPDRGGFVLGLVVLFLFAIAVAATAGYQMVTTEFTLSQTSREGQKALVIARAGLERFLAEQLGVVGDSVSYPIGDGLATVTTRKVYEKDSQNHLYHIRSEGSVADIRTPDDPARRVVSTYAWHRIAPIPHKATLFITDKRIRIQNSGTYVIGNDASSASDCEGGGTSGVYAVATGGTVYTESGGYYSGYPGAEDESYAGWSDVYEDMNLRWDVLTDPEFPVDYDGYAPTDWSALPADSFPVLRYYGDLLVAHWDAWSGGRGVLIVTGRFKPLYGFTWNGIVLAGRMDETEAGHYPYIEGMIVAGMNTVQRDEDIRAGYFQYDYCTARAANESLSYLDRVDHAVFEAN